MRSTINIFYKCEKKIIQDITYKNIKIEFAIGHSSIKFKHSVSEDINWSCLLKDGGYIKRYLDYTNNKNSYIKIYRDGELIYFLYKCSVGFNIEIVIKFETIKNQLENLIEWYEEIYEKK